MALDPQITALLQQLGYDVATIESLVFSATLITIMALVTAVPTAIIAKRKGRSRSLWLLFALSLPVIPLLIVWLLPKLPSDRSLPEH